MCTHTQTLSIHHAGKDWDAKADRAFQNIAYYKKMPSDWFVNDGKPERKPSVEMAIVIC